MEFFNGSKSMYYKALQTYNNSNNPYSILYISKMPYYNNEGILVTTGLPGNLMLSRVQKAFKRIFSIIENDTHSKIKLSL